MYKERDVETLWEKYSNLLKRLENQNVDNLIDSMDQRILMSSFSQREKEPFCGIGGNVEYALELAKKASALNKALNYDLNKASIIKCSLLSILGRVGTLTRNRYIDTTSEWHKEKLGQYYDWNEDCPKYQINDMTLFILQNYNVHLSWDEWNAISLIKDMTSEDNKFYNMHKSRLALVLQLAHETVMKDEKDKIDGEYTVPF
tara:strand:+ start:232 stop:837 length:606 start_codon:yes stop_codon:yes gene_type:complete